MKNTLPHLTGDDIDRIIARTQMQPSSICSCGLHWVQSDHKSCGNRIADFHLSLDEMQKARKVMTKLQRTNYWFVSLPDIVDVTGEGRLEVLMEATARQHAEAFILAMNLAPKATLEAQATKLIESTHHVAEARDTEVRRQFAQDATAPESTAASEVSAAEVLPDNYKGPTT